MKYDEMYKFKDFLKKQVEDNKISKETAKTYYSSLNKAFEKIDFDLASELNSESNKKHIYGYIEGLKRQNKASKVKNALRLFSECTEYDYGEDKEYISSVVSSKKNLRLTKKNSIEVAKMFRKIAGLKQHDEKLYFGYKIMQLAGTRVGTTANLKKDDFFIFEDGKIYINLRKEIMKGKKTARVELLRDDKFLNDLEVYIKNLPEDENLFYHKDTYMKKAKSYNFKCHDLRRICAKIVFRKNLRQGKNRKEAKEAVKQQLVHTGNTYKKYLSAKCNFKGVDLKKFYRGGK